MCLLFDGGRLGESVEEKNLLLGGERWIFRSLEDERKSSQSRIVDDERESLLTDSSHADVRVSVEVTAELTCNRLHSNMLIHWVYHTVNDQFYFDFRRLISQGAFI